MGRMSWLVAAVVVLAGIAPPADAHAYSVHCTFMLGFYPDQADTGLFALIESAAPGVIPNGLFYCRVPGVQGGDDFTVTPDEVYPPLVVGFSDECPGPDWDPTDPDRNGPADIYDFWVVCSYSNWEIKFTGGACGGGPGDEGCQCDHTGCHGMVPGSGDAVITQFLGTPGSGATYTES